MTITMGVCAGLVWLTGLFPQAPQAENWWNQPRGNAAGTAAVGLAGLRSQPLEEWRRPVGELLCEPVVWGGVLYVVARKDNERRLLAFRSQGGEPQGSVRLARGGAVGLAVWSGTVVVLDEGLILSFTSRAGLLKSAKRLELGPHLSPPCVLGGRLLVGDGSALHLIDIQSLKALAEVPGGQGRPAAHGSGASGVVATWMVGTDPHYREDVLRLSFAKLDGLDGKTPTLTPGSVDTIGPVAEGTLPLPGHVVYLGREKKDDVWYVLSPRPLLAQGGGLFRACSTTGQLAPITSSEAVVGRDVFGFAEDGSLIRFDEDGRHATLLARADFPQGARPGAATASSDVLYLGNWAVEVASGRVLWCLADVDPSTPVVPTEDGRVAVGTRAGELIGYRDASRTSTASTATAVAAPARPDTPAAVILADGSVLAGPLQRTKEGALQVPGSGDEPRTLAAREIAFGVTEAGERVGREQYPVFVAWRSVLFGEVQAALETLATSYARERFVADARRLLKEALEYGLSPARQRALEDTLAGKPETQDATAEAKRKKRRGEEAEARARLAQAFYAASDWCHAHDLDLAATVLVARGRRTQPEEPPTPALERALALVPPTFPSRDQGTVAQHWMEWAEELLPAEGRFLARDDPSCKGLPEDWREKSIALRTQNLLLFSFETDPHVIGPCLRKGEGTLRALDQLFAKGVEPAADRPPLEVRIHADRASYLRESEKNGLALAWTAGYYSPDENVTRFYVPRDTDRQPLERALASALAHELTHHYLDRRWVRYDPQAAEPGFWVVEGFARFIEDQVLELGRADRGFEDATVYSLDTTSQAAHLDEWIGLGRLIDLDHRSFDRLGDVPLGELRLRYTIARPRPSERSLYYDEAGSLVFFLMNRCGEKGRAALLGYLEDYYRGRTKAEGWKALGWDEAAALEQEFRAFLRTVSD